MTEQELMEDLKNADLSWKNAKIKLSRANKVVTDIESDMVEIKLRKDNLIEALRVFRLRSPIQPLTLHELEIERFRKNNPEICKFAKDRDAAK